MTKVIANCKCSRTTVEIPDDNKEKIENWINKLSHEEKLESIFVNDEVIYEKNNDRKENKN